MAFYRQHGSHVQIQMHLTLWWRDFLYKRCYVVGQCVQVGATRWPIQPNFYFDGSHGSRRCVTGHMWLAMLHGTYMGASIL